MRYLNLSRLPKATGIKSLNTRHTTPGFNSLSGLDRKNMVDRDHPAASLNLRVFPIFTCPAFSMRAVPKAILSKPPFMPPDPLLVTRRMRENNEISENKRWKKQKQKDRIDISLLFVVLKKTTNKRAVLRRQLRSKFAAAIDLVVTRGADAVEMRNDPNSPTGKSIARPLPVDSYAPLTVIASPIPTDRYLILEDWTYIITPGLKVYRMPLPHLIRAIRQALTFLKQHAARVQASWDSKLNQKGAIRAPYPERFLTGLKSDTYRRVLSLRDE
ncbi:hypothetical protein BU15DRAFT_66938 [Melanogaster broomeanus]|nr:hypothetical protein BU15DRAFT_66938 [Melanogaster broomeanus]